MWTFVLGHIRPSSLRHYRRGTLLHPSSWTTNDQIASLEQSEAWFCPMLLAYHPGNFRVEYLFRLISIMADETDDLN